MSGIRKFVLSLLVAPVLLSAQLTTAAKDERSKSRSVTGTLRLSPSYARRLQANSATGRKTLVPNRSRSIVETVKRTYSDAEQKRKSDVTRKAVELHKQAEARKTRELLRRIKQNKQRTASGRLTLKQSSEVRGSSDGAMGSKRLVKKPILIPPRNEKETKVLELVAPSSKTSERESASKKKLKR